MSRVAYVDVRWEYMILDRYDSDVERLNSFGREGWELVAVTELVVYMKRRTL